jgi:hypothetical protein
MTRGGQQDAGRLCARIIEIGVGTALSAEQPVEIVGDEVFTANVAQDEELNRAGDNLSVVHLKRLTARAGRGVYDRASVNHSFNLSFRCAVEQLACGTAQRQSSLRLSLAFTRLPRCQAYGSLGRAINHGGAKNGWSLGNESFPGASLFFWVIE